MDGYSKKYKSNKLPICSSLQKPSSKFQSVVEAAYVVHVKSKRQGNIESEPETGKDRQLNHCGVEKWSSRLAHNQKVDGAIPSSRNQITVPAGFIKADELQVVCKSVKSLKVNQSRANHIWSYSSIGQSSPLITGRF
jgi:hypothetical protein